MQCDNLIRENHENASAACNGQINNMLKMLTEN